MPGTVLCTAQAVSPGDGRNGHVTTISTPTSALLQRVIICMPRVPVALKTIDLV